VSRIINSLDPGNRNLNSTIVETLSKVSELRGTLRPSLGHSSVATLIAGSVVDLVNILRDIRCRGRRTPLVPKHPDIVSAAQENST
jgi:hypothetical protein